MSDKKKDILSHNKLAMTAPKLPQSKFPPQLKVQTYNNNVQFTIFASLENVKNGGIINAGMDPHTAWTAFEAIMWLADQPPEEETVRIEIENDAGRGKDKVLKSTTIIGKLPDGVMFLSATDPTLPEVKVKFDFNLSYYHRLSKKGGKELTKGQISSMCAKAWAKMFSQILSTHLTVNYAPPEPYNGGGGGGGNAGTGAPAAATPW